MEASIHIINENYLYGCFRLKTGSIWMPIDPFSPKGVMWGMLNCATVTGELEPRSRTELRRLASFNGAMAIDHRP